MNSQTGYSLKKLFCIEDIFFWVMLGFAFPVIFKTSLTHTGIIYVYISMLLYLFFGLFFLKVIIKTGKQEIKIIVSYLAICVWYAITLVYRYFTGGAWSASLQVCFWTIIPVTIYILMLMNVFDSKKVCARLYWAMTLLNFCSCIYCLIIVRSIRTDFLGNINMVVYFSVLGMFIYTFYYSNSNGRMNGLIYIFNMSYSVSVVLFSGSRAGVLTGVLALVLVVSLYIKNKKVMKSLGVVSLIMIIILFIALTTNFYGSKGLFFRGLNLGTISESLTSSKENVIADEHELNDLMEKASTSGNAEQVMVLNDIGRIMMWQNAVKEIKKAPLIGTGIVTVYRTSDGGQLPHNVILEYWLTYGGIGLLLWVVLAVQILYKVFKKCLSDRKRLLFILAYIATAMMYSMVEPTMTNTFGAFLFWCGVGIFSLTESGVQMKRDAAICDRNSNLQEG